MENGRRIMARFTLMGASAIVKPEMISFNDEIVKERASKKKGRKGREGTSLNSRKQSLLDVRVRSSLQDGGKYLFCKVVTIGKIRAIFTCNWSFLNTQDRCHEFWNS